MGAITAAVLLNLLFLVLTSLEISVSMWILTLAFLVFALIWGKGRAAGARWILAGLLIEQTISVAQDAILRQRWPVRQMNTFWTVKHWAFVPVAGCPWPSARSSRSGRPRRAGRHLTAPGSRAAPKAAREADVSGSGREPTWVLDFRPALTNARDTQ